MQIEILLSSTRDRQTKVPMMVKEKKKMRMMMTQYILKTNYYIDEMIEMIGTLRTVMVHILRQPHDT